jgi:glycosyltransferase involved in cell wall biosynthesis
VRPRVEIFVGEWADGGVERVTYNLLTRLDRERFEPSLVIARRYESGFALPPDVEVVDLHAGLVRFALPRLLRHFRRSSPDLLISHMTLPSSWALIARKLLRRSFPIICVEHNTLSVEYAYGKGLRRLIPRLLKVTHPWADALVSVSRASGDDLTRILGTHGPPVEVIYNPIVSSDIGPLLDGPPAHPWLEDSRYQVVVAAGRLTFQKNFGLLVEAFRTVVEGNERARLVILGEGAERESLERLISRLGLQDVVALPGFVPNPYPSMSRAAVFVLSSRYEGLPTALVEAMACGTPVITTDTPGGVREIVGDGRFGLLTPPGDAAALAAAIAAVLAGSPWTREQIRDWAAQFSVEAGARAYEELVETLLDGRHSRAS